MKSRHRACIVWKKASCQSCIMVYSSAGAVTVAGAVVTCVTAGWDVAGLGAAVGVAAAVGRGMGGLEGRPDWGWAGAGPAGPVADAGRGEEKIRPRAGGRKRASEPMKLASSAEAEEGAVRPRSSGRCPQLIQGLEEEAPGATGAC